MGNQMAKAAVRKFVPTLDTVFVRSHTLMKAYWAIPPTVYTYRLLFTAIAHMDFDSATPETVHISRATLESWFKSIQSTKNLKRICDEETDRLLSLTWRAEDDQGFDKGSIVDKVKYRDAGSDQLRRRMRLLYLAHPLLTGKRFSDLEDYQRKSIAGTGGTNQRSIDRLDWGRSARPATGPSSISLRSARSGSTRYSQQSLMRAK